ncbi:MAG TPA: hypothetical protein VN875_17335 [Candidatus Binatus sp.]|nr:hypothetical protein [Candidatus Binatus sp.]
MTSTLPSGCASSDLALLECGEATSENPGTGSLHLFVERVDIALHRSASEGPVVSVGVVNGN